PWPASGRRRLEAKAPHHVDPSDHGVVPDELEGDAPGLRARAHVHRASDGRARAFAGAVHLDEVAADARAAQAEPLRARGMDPIGHDRGAAAHPRQARALRGHEAEIDLVAAAPARLEDEGARDALLR